MPKLLILPSTTGQGDLAVAATVAERLIQRYEIHTAFFSQNSHSPFLKTIAGEKIYFSPEAHPDHSNFANHVPHLASEISLAGVDLVVALNEPAFVLAAVLADRPVIQLTHFLDPHLLRCGRKVLLGSLPSSTSESSRPGKKAISRQGVGKEQILPLLQAIHGSKPITILRIVQKLKRSLIPRSSSRLHAELTDLYGPVLATAYLSQLLCEELISHSIFPRDYTALDTLSEDRGRLDRSPTLVTHSLAPPNIPACKTCGNSSSSLPRQILLTFGGIDHPITKGLQRLLRVLNSATDLFSAQDLHLTIAGRVAETQKELIQQAFNGNRLLKEGGISIIGSAPPHEHFECIKRSDLVLTQPGYSTLAEIISADKPVVLFYGLAAYYEQYSNFVAANQSGLSLNPGRRPWLQVGEYGKYGSRRWVREQTLTNQLVKVFRGLLDGKLRSPASRAQQGHYPHYLDALSSRVDCVLRNTPIRKASV